MRRLVASLRALLGGRSAAAEEDPRCRLSDGTSRCVLAKGHPGACVLPGDLGVGNDEPGAPGALGSIW